MDKSEPFHIFSGLVHPDRETNFKSDAPPKSVIKIGRKEAIMACTKCGSPGDGEHVIKKCAGCKLTFYCSQKCQREDWPLHKQHCTSELGEGIGHLIKSVTGNPMLSHYMQVCLALIFSLHRLHRLPVDKRRQAIRAPLSVHIDVGIEPTKIADFMNLYTYPDDWDKDDIEGMLQFHNLSTPDMWEPRRSLSPKDVSIWKHAREDTDDDGEDGCAVVLTQFVNNFRQCITCIFVVGDEAIDQARRNEPFSVGSAITGKTSEKPLSVASCFEYMNTHIRADKNNQLMLRVRMRQSDKELIRDAGRQKDGHAVRMLRLKMSREGVYVSHPFDTVLEGAAARQAAASSSNNGANDPLPENRQIEAPSAEDENGHEERELPVPEAPQMNRAARRRLEKEQRKAQKRRM